MKLFLLIFLLIHPETEFQKKQKKTTKVKAFPFGTWMRSQEEDKDPNASWLLYRPGTYDFPPARGRSGFIVQKDGKFALIGPDRRDTTWGTWKQSSSRELEIAVPDRGLKKLSWRKSGKNRLEVELK
jgi:hypothetical protein